MSRRGALDGAGAPSVTPPHLDADLIHWCDAYLLAAETYNTAPGDDEDDRPWDAVMRAEAEVDARPPRTLAGLVAMASVALELAGQEPEERTDWSSSPAGSWARDVTLHLLRLSREGAV
jgi:hypothetical protein